MKIEAKRFKIRLKTGDMVMVRSGKYKGQTGKITQVHPSLNKVTVEGINVVKRHVKPNRQHPQGSIVELTKPIWVSKVGIVNGTSKKPSRIAYKLTKDGPKTRVYAGTTKEIK
ncbi:MAG TPA: 50S ribosomal protein L24 [Candidatus Saccharimonadales bacterium]|nr:50S ribosomal protein L24 [Candidatus Saccharimonadales bacterium]